jgi:formylglycine-generating enzyme required for sulfatase activity
MASLPGGALLMGGGEGDDDEQPEHTVTLSPFSIDKHETSYAEYDSCVRKGVCSPAHYDDGKCLMWTSEGIARVRVPPQYRSPDYPVVCVTWYQAKEYCSFRGKRLPTEAQWEYAALAGGSGTYTWGSQQPSSSRCTSPENRRPLASGTFPPNAWGLYDMTGNVWEWTYDLYQKDFYSYSEPQDPSGPPVGRYRVIRGGGWYSGQSQLRSKNRQWLVPEYGEVSVGIRCAK